MLHDFESYKNDELDKMSIKVKSEDSLNFHVSDDFFEQLHDKIMSRIEEVEMAPAPMSVKPKRVLRAHWREWLYPLGVVISMII